MMFMKISNLVTLVILAIALASCASPNNQRPDQVTHGEHYPILDVLPRRIEGFTYEGSSTYPDPLGYSLRYQNDNNLHAFADIYLYPAPPGAASFTHEEIVVGVTNEALQEIDYFKQRGLYSEFKIISSGTFEIQGKTVSRVEIHLVKNNLVLYSLLYVTESDGKLIKARMSMPNNDANRTNEAWTRFIKSAFATIINNIDKA
jgi:hypothetical protein